jgi:hypothetical protein
MNTHKTDFFLEVHSGASFECLFFKTELKEKNEMCGNIRGLHKDKHFVVIIFAKSRKHCLPPIITSSTASLLLI